MNLTHFFMADTEQVEAKHPNRHALLAQLGLIAPKLTAIQATNGGKNTWRLLIKLKKNLSCANRSGIKRASFLPRLFGLGLLHLNLTYACDTSSGRH